MDFLKYDIDIENIAYLQSIPRLLQDALIGLKSFVNANLSIDFSKIAEPKTNPLKTGLVIASPIIPVFVIHLQKKELVSKN